VEIPDTATQPIFGEGNNEEEACARCTTYLARKTLNSLDIHDVAWETALVNSVRFGATELESVLTREPEFKYRARSPPPDDADARRDWYLQRAKVLPPPPPLMGNMASASLKRPIGESSYDLATASKWQG
jgi:hypothetical protein